MSKEILLKTQDGPPGASSLPTPKFRPDNPKLAITYKILSGIVVCINLLCMKVLYEYNPDLGTAQLLVFRSSLSVLLLFSYHNTHLKYILYDSVDRGSVPPLISRMITGNFGIFIVVMAAKYFTLTVVAMVINCAPFVSLFLAGPILGEKITISQVAVVAIAFSGLALMILGGN